MAAESRRFESDAPERTEELAARLAAVLPDGTVVALEGDLGSGKTCFVRGLARGLGCEAPVASPTYTLMRELPGPRPLYHFDAWMEGRERAFLEGGGVEWLHAGGLAAIEWAGRVGEWLPEPRLRVFLEHRAPTRRRITMEVVGEGPAAEALRGALRSLGTGIPEPPGG